MGKAGVACFGLIVAIVSGCSTESPAPASTPPAAALSPGERLVFIGTYTDEHSKGIYTFHFNDQTGALRPAGLAIETPSPTFLTASADGRFVYSVNEVSNYGGEKSGSVSAFAVDRTAGRLTVINTVSSRGADPCHLAIDRTGKFLAVANYTGGSFAIFPIGTDGRLGEATAVVARSGSGPDALRQEGPHAHAVVFDATNRFLVGADLGTDRILTYAFDESTGVTKLAGEAVVSAGAGPRHFVFDPAQPVAFSINELRSTITTFGWDPSQGRLKPRGSVSALPSSFRGQSTTAEIAIHPNGRFLYGSNRGHDSIVVFKIADGGRLTLVEHESTRGRTPRNFVIDLAGRWLLVGNQDSNTVVVFKIDSQTGALTPVGEPVAAPKPVALLFLS